MKEDLKIIEEIKESIDTNYGSGRRKVQAIENLIKAYKELEEENKTLKNVVSEIFNSEDITDDYIPISLVEEKIEELNRKIKYEDNEKVIIWLHKQKKILQELLEKR